MSDCEVGQSRLCLRPSSFDIYILGCAAFTVGWFLNNENEILKCSMKLKDTLIRAVGEPTPLPISNTSTIVVSAIIKDSGSTTGLHISPKIESVLC